LSNSGYCGKTGSGNVAPVISAGLGPEEAEFIKRLWMSTSIRNFAGAGDAISFPPYQDGIFKYSKDATG
jgi:hypothetical protein